MHASVYFSLRSFSLRFTTSFAIIVPSSVFSIASRIARVKTVESRLDRVKEGHIHIVESLHNGGHRVRGERHGVLLSVALCHQESQTNKTSRYASRSSTTTNQVSSSHLQKW